MLKKLIILLLAVLSLQLGLSSSYQADFSSAKKGGVSDVVLGKADELGGLLVKDEISSTVLKKVTKWDKNVGDLVEYPKYNNVALGKDMNGKLAAFGDEVGANVWTSRAIAL